MRAYRMRPCCSAWKSRVLAAVISLVAAACSHAPAPAAPDWTYDYSEYFGDASASTFAPDVVVLISATGLFNRPIVALDPATGKVRFQTTGTAALRNTKGVLYVAAVAREPGRSVGRYVLSEVDPQNGSMLRTIALSPALEEFPQARFAIAESMLLAIDERSISAYRLSDGARIWREDTDRATSSKTLLLSDRIVLAGEVYAAYRVSDGRRLWRWHGTCCALAASPDGRRFYVADGQRTAVLDENGKRVGTLADGVPKASSADWIAVANLSGMSVYRHGEHKPTLHMAEGQNRHFSAIALHDDSVLYFDSADNTIWMTRIRDGRRARVHRSGQKLVVGPDASGVAQGYVAVPPIVTADHIYVWDWQLHAYPPLGERGMPSMPP